MRKTESLKHHKLQTKQGLKHNRTSNVNTQDICSTEQFQKYYHFFTQDQQNKIRKYQNNQKIFAKLMRNFKEGIQKNAQNQNIYFPRNIQNFKAFMQFLKKRNEVQQKFNQNSQSNIQEKVQGLHKLFSLTKQYQNQNTHLQISERKKKLRRPQTTDPKLHHRVHQREKQNTISYDDYGNVQMTFKKLNKMCAGIEQYRSEEQIKKKFIRKQPLKNHTIFIKQTIVKKSKKDRLLSEEHQQEEKRKFKKYETKLKVDLSQPVFNFNLKKSKNYMKIKKEVTNLIQKAKNSFGLHFLRPQEIEFNDSQIKQEILSIKPSFLYQTEPKKVKTIPLFQQPQDDKTVPKSLLQTLKNWKKNSFYSKINIQDIRSWTSHSKKRENMKSQIKTIDY